MIASRFTSAFNRAVNRDRPPRLPSTRERAQRVTSGAARLVLVLIGAAAGALGVGAFGAETEGSFTARLGWVPISGAERNEVAGHGTAAAALSGSRVSITGSFEGLPAPATAARLHHGVAKGARGPVIADLVVPAAAGGTLSGEVDLSLDEVEALKAGRLYVQIHAERGVPPDGAVLWGWLLP